MNKELREKGQTITLPDGRKLGYLIIGEGKPVFHFHGGLSSRLEVLVLEEMAESKHLQIIGVDRPGFGLSTYAPKRRMSNFIKDVCLLADHLEIDKFLVTGYSIGGSYAITCAALLAERVIQVVVISGLSLPLNTSELPRIDRILFITTPIIGGWIQKKYRNTILKIVEDPDSFLKSEAGRKMLIDLPEDMASFLYTPSRSRDVLLMSMKEAYHQGSDSIRGMIQERKLMKKGWDADLSKIPSGTVNIWHGTLDKNIPIDNAYRNSEAISGTHLETFEGEGHTLIFNNLRRLGEILG